MSTEIPASEITPNLIFTKLHERVSTYNARLLLKSALVGSGVQIQYDGDQCMNMEDAKSLCLELIKKGGPAFQVGQAVYKQYLQ